MTPADIREVIAAQRQILKQAVEHDLRHSKMFAHPTGSHDGDRSTRCSLSPDRSSVTHKFCVGGHEGYLTIGLHKSGEPGEIFIKMSKEGSTMSGMCQAFCRAFSLSIQYGLPLHEAVARFKGMRFEPMGATNNKQIPESSSIVDYVAKYLEHEFVRGDAGRIRIANRLTLVG